MDYYQFFSENNTNRAINTKFSFIKNCMKLHSSVQAINTYESHELAMRNSMFSAGVYADLNPMYNDVCPPHHMDDNLFQHHQSMGQTYPTQYSSPADHQSQQMPIVPYGAPQNDHRSFSPGMSNSSNDLRNMGIPAHLSTDVDRHASPGPHSLNAASKPDMQWMVTTSHIDMRSVTPPNAVVAHSSMHQNPLIPHGQKASSVTISHSGYTNPSSSTTADGKPRLTKSGKPRGTPGRKRKVEDHDLSPEEAAKRRVRRERNKLAAAKCRNRRRELTDRLQGETDILEDHQGMLTQEIMALQQEKDHLEFILASHTPICKVLQDKTMNLMGNESPKDVQCMNSNDCIALGDHHDHEADLLSAVDTINEMNNHQRLNATTVSVIQAGPSLTNSNARPIGENIFGQQTNSVIVGSGSLMPNSFTSHNDCQRPDLGNRDHRRFPPALPDLDIGSHTGAIDALNTPVCSLATPSNTSSVFTFPNTPCVTSNSATTSVMNSADVAFNCGDFNATTGNIMSSGHGNFGAYNNHESCSAAHRRSSSSEPHTSPDSVKSPKLLSL